MPDLQTANTLAFFLLLVVFIISFKALTFRWAKKLLLAVSLFLTVAFLTLQEFPREEAWHDLRPVAKASASMSEAYGVTFVANITHPQRDFFLPGDRLLVTQGANLVEVTYQEFQRPGEDARMALLQGDEELSYVAPSPCPPLLLREGASQEEWQAAVASQAPGEYASPDFQEGTWQVLQEGKVKTFKLWPVGGGFGYYLQDPGGAYLCKALDENP